MDKVCCGRTPMETLIDGKGVWRAIDALLNAIELREKRP